jgi:hypothetical protein
MNLYYDVDHFTSPSHDTHTCTHAPPPSLTLTHTITHTHTHTPSHPSHPLTHTMTHITALAAILKVDPIKRKLMEAMTIRESTSYAMARVHHALKKVAVNLVSLCHVDPVAQRLSSSR